jgi:hypothetical protein
MRDFSYLKENALDPIEKLMGYVILDSEMGIDARKDDNR